MPDTGKTEARKKLVTSLRAKLYRVPFNYRVALLLWYLFYLAQDIYTVQDEVRRVISFILQAEQIKSSTITICQKSELYCNTILGASHDFAEKANNETQKVVQLFLDETVVALNDGIIN